MKIFCKACRSAFRLDSSLIKSGGSLVRCSKCQGVFRVYPPRGANRRKFPRIKTRNLISHLSLDEEGRIISQGLGKALDISRGGMLIETPDPIPAGRLSLMAVDKDNVLFEIQAELVYCNEIHPGIFQAGIKFTGTQLQVIDHVTRLIKEYSYRKKYLYIDLPQWE